MSKAGRPPIEIKQEDFEKLCGLQCPLEEIASWFKCSADTIERWCKKIYGMNFAEVYKKHSASGKISLRRYQFNLAKTNASMAIWLGKQMLGQREPKSEFEMSVTNENKEIMREYLESVKKRT